MAQDKQGNYYVSEYGEFDRIQKFSPDGRFIRQWGGHGYKPGQFIRPQKIVFDEDQHLWVADACNHRIQVFDTEGKLLRCWGKEGSGPGELYYPYDLALGPAGTMYVCEFGNHRVQKFTRDGRSLGCWGQVVVSEGELYNPWALVRDSQRHHLRVGYEQPSRASLRAGWNRIALHAMLFRLRPHHSALCQLPLAFNRRGICCCWRSCLRCGG